MHLRSKSVLTLGTGGSDDSDSASADGMSGGGQTVATQSISGVDDVLVDSSGMALYTNDLDSRSKIACTDQCLAEWLPLAAPSGRQPGSDDASVQEKLGTVQRPDGSSQVTFDGLPLYTFVDDTPGQVTGNGFSDSFGGDDFVWTVATATGETTPSSTTTTESPGVYGGY
jgi:predicted lipoprotein with Yx(FWY)xxD motif